MKAPASFETERLLLRRPGSDDAVSILERYASDPDVTRFLGWPRHRSLEDTRAFLAFGDAQWARWPAGPYLIVSRCDGALLGSTGLAFDTPDQASTGYVLAKDAWGRGYATEALQAMVGVASRLAVRKLYALCHPDHRASWRVLEKCGFERDEAMGRKVEFPNLEAGTLLDAWCYSTAPNPADAGHLSR